MSKTKRAPRIEWPADAVTRRPVAELQAHPRNARVHDERQIARIAASIEKWGWTIPVLVDEEGVLIAGHGRVEAARTLGIADVPCMVAAGWSDAKKRAYMLADNRIAETSKWDAVKLGAELSDLEGLEGFTLADIAFDDFDLASLPGFDPTLDPTAAQSDVTDGDVEGAQDRLEGMAGRAAGQQVVDVICPHCGGEFGVDPALFEPQGT